MNDEEKRLARAVLGREDAPTVPNILARTCPDGAVQRGMGETPMSDPIDAVQRGQLCSKCPDILAGIARIEATVGPMQKDIEHVRAVQGEMFTKLDHLKETSAEYDKRLALLAQEVREDTQRIAEAAGKHAENAAMLKGAGISAAMYAFAEWVRYKLAGK